MLLKIKTVWVVTSIIAALFLPSCGPSLRLPATEVVHPATPSQPTLKTTMGDFLISSVRLVDEVHGDKSQSGEKFLLVILTQSDFANLVPEEFSLESFQSMIHDSNGQIYVVGDDGAPIISTMAGWLEDEFAMGFRVPIVTSYTLYWPGNSPIELHPKTE